MKWFYYVIKSVLMLAKFAVANVVKHSQSKTSYVKGGKIHNDQESN